MSDEVRPLSGFNVLIVEDEFFVSDDLRSALSDEGATVIGPVPNCSEALALLRLGTAIDLAVLDVRLA